MPRRILVPLDGSALADRAVGPAAAIARRTDAELHLVSVHHSAAAALLAMGAAVAVAAASEELDRAQCRELTAHLERTRRALDLPPDHAVRTEVLDGGAPVPEQLDAYAAANSIDLVVMTTHGRGAIGRFLIGSVAEGLLRRSTRPCLVLRAESATPAAARAAFHRVLVPLDGSPEAERAIDAALDLMPASSAGADLPELLLGRVIVPLPWLAPDVLPHGGPDWTGGALAVQREIATQYLDAAVARLQDRGIRARGIVTVGASPAGAILDLATGEAVDLIAMAARARGGADRFLLGSVMDRVVRGASVPTLVARGGELGAR
ncbi:MAG TPA: universal stress protein [Gemmatimonadales bacterium]|nr:universal stress protein [Gemmatimonadales bacterium]